MKKHLLLAVCSLVSVFTMAQSVADATIPVWVKHSSNPPTITLTWSSSINATEFVISRKYPGENTWTNLATVALSDTTYTDSTVQLETAYEYLLRRKEGSSYHYGVIAAGINLKAKHARGSILIVADSGLKNRIKDKYHEFLKGLSADGWQVNQLEVGTGFTHFQIKDSIKVWHTNKPFRNNTVLLFGDIPVPYSGYINPDAHPEHRGCWPADVYYGNFSGTWEDKVTFETATRVENKNYPGDGKFDQDKVPGEVVMEIGRIDLHNITTLGTPTDSLYIRYIEKDLAFRTNTWDVPRRILFDDKLGVLGGENPGRNGLVYGYALVGPDSITVSNNAFISTLTQQPYLLSHASSYGSYTGNGQVQASNFKVPFYNVFGAYFGSYHGDWDNTNNLLRTAIAGPGYTLTSVWAGRPQWHFHHLGMGYPIGYSAKITQNNFIDQNHQTYDPGASAGYVHVALHGDPTLRLHPIKAPSAIQATAVANNTEVNLSWSSSADQAISGYHVYRSDSIHGVFNLLNTSPIAGNSFTDADPLKGKNVYLIKAIRLESSTTGTYWNLSSGEWASIENVNGTAQVLGSGNVDKLELTLYPNPAKDIFSIGGLNESKTELIIYNSLGQRIKSQTVDNQSNQVSIRELNNGIYYVHLKQNQTVEVIRLIIQN